jgi:hypothetical protein
VNMNPLKMMLKITGMPVDRQSYVLLIDSKVARPVPSSQGKQP